MPLKSDNNSKKKKSFWSKIIAFFRKNEKQEKQECDHLYFPHEDGEWVIGQKCFLCDKFNSCEELGIRPFRQQGYKGYDDTQSF